MLNLKEIVRLAERKSFGNIFNLMKKKVIAKLSEEEEKFYREHPEFREDVPQGPLGGDVGVPPPPEPDVPLEQPQPYIPTSVSIDPAQVSERMDEWIRSNRDEIAYENDPKNVPLDTLIDKKNNTPEESPLAPDPVLYKALLQDRNLVGELANKLRSVGVVEKGRAETFIDIMMAKTQQLAQSFDIRGKAIEEEEKRKLEEKEKRVTKKREVNPYYKPPVVNDPDPKNPIWTQAQTIISEMSPEQRSLLNETMNLPHGFSNVKLSKAVFERLGPPEEGYLDQRMNFFLQNPQHLQKHLDANLSNVLKTELGKIGINEKDLNSSLRKAALKENRGAKTKVCNILSVLKGPELVADLQNLVINNDPAVAKWIAKGFFEGGMEPSYNVEDESGKQMAGNIRPEKAMTTQEKIEDSPEEIAEASLMVSSLTKQYLQNVVDSVKNISDQFLVPVMFGSAKDHKQIALEIGTVKTKRHQQFLKDKMKDMVEEFTVTETMRAFSLSSLKQLDDIFSVPGTISSSDKDSYTYSNRFGEIVIPRNVLDDIFYGEGEERLSILNKDPSIIKERIDEYRQKVESGEIDPPFSSVWKDVNNYRIPYISLAKVGEVFNKIRLMKKKNQMSIKEIRQNILKDEGLKTSVFQICGINDQTPSKVSLLDDFVYMTLHQDENDKNISRILEIYNAYEKNQARRKKISEMKNPQIRDERLRDLEAEERKMIKSLKSKIGYSYFPILYQMLEASEAVGPDGNYLYSTEKMRAFVDMFDHYPSPLRNLYGFGVSPNRFDLQKRTNTELYYKARREPIPSHVESLLAMKRDKEAAEKNKTLTNKQKVWYANFWKLYDSLGLEEREFEKIKSKIEPLDKFLDSKYELANYRVKKLLQDRKDLEARLMTIKSPAVRQKVQQDLLNWDETKNLPIEYYVFLGQKATGNVLTQAEKEKKELGIQFKEISSSLAKKKQMIAKELEKAGYKADLRALKLVDSYYKAMIKKVSYLETIMHGLSKFASRDISPEDIALRIDLCHYDFHNYFQKIVPRLS